MLDRCSTSTKHVDEPHAIQVPRYGCDELPWVLRRSRDRPITQARPGNRTLRGEADRGRVSHIVDDATPVEMPKGSRDNRAVDPSRARACARRFELPEIAAVPE